MGSCQPLGQYRIRRRRQGLQAQDCHYRISVQKRHRLGFQKCRNQEFIHDPVQDRSCNKVLHSDQVFRDSCRNQVFDLFRQQGVQDGRNGRKVILRSDFRQHQVCLDRLQPLFLLPFHDLQQAVHDDLQQAFDLIFLHQVFQLRQRRLQIFKQPFLQYFGQLFLKQFLQELGRLQRRRI